MALASFVTVFIIGAVVAVNVIDWNRYRGQVRSLVEAQLGVTVTIAGDLGLSLDPLPALTVQGLTLSHPTTGEVIADVERLAVRVGVGALLKGEISVDRAEVERMSMRLAQDPSGGWYVAGWPRAEDTGADPASEGRPISVGSLTISDSRITVEPTGGRVYAVGLDAVDLSGRFPSGPFEVDGRIVHQGQSLDISTRRQPLLRRDGSSFRLVIDGEGLSLETSGREEADGTLSMRFQLSADSAPTVFRHLDPGHQAEVPPIPLAVDLSLSGTAPNYDVTVRLLQVGRSQGRFTGRLTGGLDDSQAVDLSGALALGVLDIGELRQFEPYLFSTAEGQQDGSGTAALTATLDVTAEQISLQAQSEAAMAQQLEAQLELFRTGARLNEFQALLPGASRLALRGQIADFSAPVFAGDAQIETSRLSDLAAAFGASLPEGLETGRLSTLQASADVEADANSWTMTDLVGQLDTSQFSGTVSGNWQNAVPGRIDIRADRVNADAYLGGVATGADGDSACGPATCLRGLSGVRSDISLRVGALRVFAQDFADVTLRARADGDELAVETLTARGGEGRIDSTVTLRDLSSEPAVTAILRAEKWPVNLALWQKTGLPSELRPSGIQAELRLNGSLNAPRLGVDLQNGDDLVAFTGTVQLDTPGNLQLEGRGSVRHRDIAPLGAEFGLTPTRAISVDATAEFDWSQEGGFDRLEMSGALGGARGQLALAAAPQNALAGRISIDHPRLGTLADALGTHLVLVSKDAPLSVSAGVVLQDAQRWTVNDIQAAIGVANIEGALQFDGTELSGRINLAQVQLTSLTSDLGSASNDTSTTDVDLSDIALEINAENVLALGQRLDAPNIALSHTDGQWTFALGPDARVNQAPATAQLTYNNVSSELGLRGQLNQVSLEGALNALGLPVSVNGTANLDMDLRGGLNPSVHPLAGLRGRAEVSGSDVTLAFIDVPGLVSDIESSENFADFLKGLDGRLRRNRSLAKTFEAAFALETGTILVERAVATLVQGTLDLDGQLNLPSDRVALKGQLQLNTPPNAPPIALAYEGSLANPASTFVTDQFEKLVFSRILRRTRGTLFSEQNARESASGEALSSPGLMIFRSAKGVLDAIGRKQKQEA